MNSNSTANTELYVLASNIINFDDLDEITNRLKRIAQQERQLLHDFTESIENILNRASSNTTGYMAGRLAISSPGNQLICTVCLDKPRDCVLEPCMHVCCCISCLQLITDNKCPVCRTPIDFYLKLYIS
jgi:hypothetical protein